MTTIIKCLILTLLAQCHAGRLADQIYSDIEGSTACFRRLNGTHQFGCSSADSGAIGAVHVIKSIVDAQWLVNNSTSGVYIVVVHSQLFHDIINLLMANSEKVSGVLIHENDFKTTSFSQDSQCPNEYSSVIGSKCKIDASGDVWNPIGTNLLHMNVPFPIFYLPPSKGEEVLKIVDCYKRFNEFDKENQASRPLCYLQLNSFMFAAVNTEVCLRRSGTSSFLTTQKVCDPLGDKNVYYSLFPRVQPHSTNETVTLVTARIDAASMFDGLSPGAASSVVGLVSLISAASTLSKMLPPTDFVKYKHNILWTMFSGESFDYIGSQRVAFDLEFGMWPPNVPVEPSQIDLHVELGQLGGAISAHNDSLWPLTAYTPEYSGSPVQVSEFVESMNQMDTNMSLKLIINDNLPPSSIHSFRRILTNASQMYELVLVDHEAQFTNKFYQSALDTADNIGFKYKNITLDNEGHFVDTEEVLAAGNMTAADPQVKIARLATTVARALYRRITDTTYSGNVTTSAHMVDELLYCYLQNRNCRLLVAADYGPSEGQVPEASEPPVADPFPMYVGVWNWYTGAPTATGHLLALLTGAMLNLTNAACLDNEVQGYSHYWLNGFNRTGVCVQTTMNFTDALSPAFIIPDYDYKSGMYSTWTESVWRSTSARVFVSASGGGWRAAAISGAFSTLLAFAATYWLRKHAGAIFVSTSATSNDNLSASENNSRILRSVNC